MGNTLTGLIPIIYQAAIGVGRELTGMIPSVFMNAGAEQAAVGQTITYPIAPAASAVDIVAGPTPPDDGDQSFDNDTMKISNSKMVPIRWTGEEEVAIGSMGADLLKAQFEEAMRTLTNAVESDLTALYTKSSRVYGVAGTTPFGKVGDFTDASEVRKILVDNGAPQSGLQLVIDTSAGSKIRGKQAQAQIDGDTNLQRQGIIHSLSGLDIRESAQIKQHAKGTTGSMSTNGALAVGASSVAIDGGTGDTLAGDVVSFADGDKNRYVVGTGVTGAGTIVLGNPGLRTDVTDGQAMTVDAGYTANMAFHRNAIHLIARPPAMPKGGDAADDVTYIMDPVSGLIYQVAVYRQYRQIRYEVGLAWGVKAVQGKYIALILG